MSGHNLALRVYYEDTDFSGLVYHASYVRFLERGRTEFLREAGIDQASLYRHDGLVFVVRRMTIDWLKPAGMDDVIQVETRLAEIKGASLRLAQAIRKDGQTLCVADALIAAAARGRSVRLPQALRGRLADWLENPHR